MPTVNKNKVGLGFSKHPHVNQSEVVSVFNTIRTSMSIGNAQDVKVPFSPKNQHNTQNNPTPIAYPKNQLSERFNIKPDAVVNVNLGNVKGDAKFIPQHMLRSLTGQAAGYAVSRGDYFGGITFLSEGVRSNAFYFDPASGSRGKGVLINTHPGITLPYQSDKEIRNMFGNTSLAGMTEEILRGVRNGQMSSNMKNAHLRVGDYYNMFKHVQDKYTAGANGALLGVMNKNSFAQKLLAEGHSKQEVLRTIKEQLPVTSYAVLQHLAYKYGNGGIKRFTNLLNHTISAGLDTANQEKHLADGAKYIVYHYRDGKNVLHQDTRVMNIHRLFYTAGVKFSPELNMKIISNQELNATETQLVNSVATSAGLGKLVQNGKINLPDGDASSTKNSRSEKFTLDIDAANKGIMTVNQNFKPIQPPVEHQKHHETDIVNKHSVSHPKAAAGSCMSFSCMTIRIK